MESPIWPVRRWPRYCTYWTGSGWSSPRRCRQPLQLRRGRVLAEHDQDGIARRHVDQRKRQQRHAEQNEQRVQQPLRDIADTVAPTRQ